jgi:pimeloyl-ACP methyl ester carboxylesterase
VRRGLRIVLGLLVVLAALAAINAIVLDSQRKPAEVNAPGGEIIHLDSVDLQVIDQPAIEQADQGEPIVLLHCFGCSSRWWDPIVPLLNEHHRVIRIDLLGHGGSEKPTSGYEISAQGGNVAEVLRRLNVTGATVVGHSLGGMVATAAAETASELVDRVVLISTPSEPDSADLPRNEKLSHVPVLGEALWRLRLDSMIRSGYANAFAPGFDVKAAFDDPNRVVEDNRAMTYTSFADSSTKAEDYLDQQPIASRLRATGVPVLAIEGDEDQILDPDEVAAQYETIPGAQVETLKGVGHSANVEAPVETARLILSFAEAGVTAPSATKRHPPSDRPGKRKK